MRKHIDGYNRDILESNLRDLMLDYRNTDNPVLRAKIRRQVTKAMEEFDVQPLGYRGLPYWMKE